MLPSFFKENKKSKGNELFFDYYLSWAFRCAKELPEGSTETDNNVHQTSKKILCWILDLDYSKTTILDVSTYKQWCTASSKRDKADLMAEITLLNDNVEEHHAVLIEKKLYTNLAEDQLGKYKENFDSHVDSLDKQLKTKYKRHYFVFTSLNDDQCVNDTALCEEYEFQFYDFTAIVGELKENGLLELNPDGSFKPTGNYMFDAFWFDYIVNP